MIPYFLTTKEQKKLELFQFLLFAEDRKTSKEIISKFEFTMTTFRRYIQELSDDITSIFGESVRITTYLRQGTKVTLSSEMTVDYILATLRLTYIKNNPLYALINKLATKKYYSVTEIALDLNFSESVVYRLLAQLNEILNAFDATINLESSFNFDGDEMGVRYFLYLTYWNLFQDSYDYNFSKEFTNSSYLKTKLHIKKNLTDAQEKKLKILSEIISYRIIYLKKPLDISDALLEDITYFDCGEPTLNIQHSITSQEILKKESILFSFVVRGAIFTITTFEEKQLLVHEYKHSDLSINKQVTSFLEDFQKMLDITYTANNYVESYYMILMAFIYIKHFHFKVDDYLTNPIKDNINLYKENNRYISVLPKLKPFLKQLPFKNKISSIDEHTFTLLLYILYEINSAPEPLFIYVTHNTNMAEVNLIKSGIKKVFNEELISFSETPYEADIIVTDTFEGDFKSKNVFYFNRTSDKKTWSDLYDFILKCIFEDTFE